MSHAEKCPVCDGKGTVTIGTNTTIGSYEKVCHGCNGRGWVTVQDLSRTKYPVPLYPVSGTTWDV